MERKQEWPRDGASRPVAAPLAKPAAPDSIAPMVGAAMSAAAPAATPLPALMHALCAHAPSLTVAGVSLLSAQAANGSRLNE